MMINLLGQRLYLKTSLVYMVNQPLSTLLILSFTNKLMALQWNDQHLQQQQILCSHMNKLQYLRHYILQKFRKDLLMTFIPLHSIHINDLHQNIKFTVKEEINEELAFLDTLLIRNNGEISVLVNRKPTHTEQYRHYSSHH